MELIYADIKRALQIHDKILELSGGLPGVKSRADLESVLHTSATRTTTRSLRTSSRTWSSP